MEMTNLQELPFVIASDFKLINVMLGLCGQGESKPADTAKLRKG